MYNVSTYDRLLEERTIFIGTEIEAGMANEIVAQMIELESKDPLAPITMYINSPGGVVTSGLAIKNTMDYISCPVHTVGLGMCASMGAFLLASGEKGHRIALKDTTIMIHQPLGGAKGQATDIVIQSKEIVRLKTLLTQYMSDYTNGKIGYDEMYNLCERDNYLTPENALELGLIDAVIVKREEVE